MKLSRYLLFFLVFVVLLSGCMTSVRYDLSEFNQNEVGIRIIADGRDNTRVDSKITRDAIIYVGDQSITPSVAEIVSRKLSKLSANRKPELLSATVLREFELLIYFPQHSSISRGAALAGISYSAAILSQGSASKGAPISDGVIAHIVLQVDSVNYSCSSHLPAYREVAALFGPAVSGKGLQKSFDSVIESCLEKIVVNAAL